MRPQRQNKKSNRRKKELVRAHVKISKLNVLQDVAPFFECEGGGAAGGGSEVCLCLSQLRMANLFLLLHDNSD